MSCGGKKRCGSLRSQYPTLTRSTFLQFRRDPLDFVHDPQQVGAPEFFYLLFSIASADKLQGYVEGFAGVVPADDAAATVEVRRDPNVVDTDELHGIINMVDEIFDRRGRITRVLLVNLGVFVVVRRPMGGRELLQRGLEARPLARTHWFGQTVLLSQSSQGRCAVG
jgi:hypothetical protein